MTPRVRVCSLLVVFVLCTGFEWEGRLGRLQRELAAGDARQRRDVVRLMAGYPASEVGEALLTALEDEDEQVRLEAARSAGRVRLADAVPMLQEWLDDPEPELRTVAASALGAIGDPRPIPDLVRALGDQDTGVRRAAVGALLEAARARPDDREIATPILGRLDDADPEVRIDAATALGELADPRAVVPLVGRARDQTPEVRTAVYGALGALGDARAVSALAMGLRDEAEAPRLAAVRALGRIGSDRAVAPLVALLGGVDPRTGQAVITALGAIGSARALDAIVGATARPELRVAAGHVLAEHPDAALTARLADRVRRARDVALVQTLALALARRLERRPAPEAAPALIAALRVSEAPVVLLALARSGDPEVVVPLLESMVQAARTGRSTEPALDALDAYLDLHPHDGRAADPLLSILGDVPPAHRGRVVSLLGRVRAARALPSVRPLLDHPEPALRIAAAEAIGAIGDPRGAEALRPLLDDENARLRMVAARGLGRSIDAEGLAQLRARLVDPSPVDRHALLVAIGIALGRDEDPVAPSGTLVEALADVAGGPDRPLASRAIEALARAPGDAARDALGELLGTSRRRRALAAFAWRPDGLAALREALSAEDANVRLVAATALGEVGERPDVARLLELAESAPFPIPAGAVFGVATLVERGVAPELDDAERGRLCALLGRRDAHVRANVLAALTASGATCPDRTLVDLLGPAHSTLVRVPAALHLRRHPALREDGIVQARLESCARTDLVPEVAEACQAPTDATTTHGPVELVAYAADSSTPIADRLVALRFVDGRVLVTPTDAAARLVWPRAPRGPLQLDDPLRTPLQP